MTSDQFISIGGQLGAMNALLIAIAKHAPQQAAIRAELETFQKVFEVLVLNSPNPLAPSLESATLLHLQQISETVWSKPQQTSQPDTQSK